MNLVIFLISFLNFQSTKNELKIGWYQVKLKNENHEILIKTDSTFVFLKGRYDYSFGNWQIVENRLILNSKPLSMIDSISVALRSGHYFRMKNEQLRIKRGKLIDSHEHRFKFKEK
jgi:hypothetical protein